jgi:hypothetical protein
MMLSQGVSKREIAKRLGISPQEVGVADEETLAVVVGIDELAGDVVGR